MNTEEQQEKMVVWHIWTVAPKVLKPMAWVLIFWVSELAQANDKKGKYVPSNISYMFANK